MNKRTISICGAAMFLSLLVSSAFGYEKEIEELSAQMAEKIAGKGKKTVAVVDFTDLEGNVTQLDQFIAEEFSVALASAGKGFRVIDRTRLKSIIKENKLAATGLIDPATASKLGKIAGVDALVTGTLTPFGDNVRLTVKVLDSETADIIDSAKSNFAKTQAINELFGKEIDSKNVSSLTERTKAADGKTADSQVVKGILFEAKGCKLSGGSLICRLLVTSQDEDKEISVFNDHDWSARTRVFDNMSNEYRASMLEIANKKSRSSSAGHTLVSGVATKLAFTFEGIKESMESLSLLEVAFSDENDNRSKAQLRNIPVSR
ncbi:MAG: TolB amino-terminal domain-containing protein [Candidatus Electronema aureum]|uniref:TolB amino-terminal domain-containing protein n=1 Tax=Candidatus Electronema aureum TaxID=2005002 RepID=A0A521G314_9BACT|nr:MAG: TolB amino-terminal domain-containing protein [Candidatus Electronema aureum]